MSGRSTGDGLAAPARPSMRARRSAAVVRAVVALAVSALAAIGARTASADLPGTIPLGAAGGGHLWWVVEAPEGGAAGESAPGRGGARGGAEALGRHLVMHHARIEPAPTERLVMRLPQAPEAMAAEANALVLVMRPEGGAGRRLVLRVRAERNEAVGHWYTLPREGPEILAPLRGDGTLHATALVDGRLYALLRLPAAPGRPGARWWMGSAPAGGAGRAEWTEHVPPAESVSDRVSLLGSEGALVAMLWRDSARDDSAVGTSMRLRRLDAERGWVDIAAESTDASIDISTDGAVQVPVQPFGGISVDGRLAVVCRTGPEGRAIERPLGLPPAEAAGMPAAADDGRLLERRPSLEVVRVRRGVATPWAWFDEPTRPWLLAPFGADAALLVLDESRRATVSLLAPSATVPSAPVVLAPPGFAASHWVHLPILGVVSIGFVLLAVIFGSDAYLANRRGPRANADLDGLDAAPARPRGAPLGQRALAMAADLLPGILAAWAIYGGNPLELVRFPVFIGDLATGQGAIVACGIGWAWGFVGDVLLGRSLGKRLLGLEIRLVDGAPAGIGRRFWRGLLAAVSVASPPVMLLALLHPQRDGPAEMLSGTCVVDPGAESRSTGEVGAD